MRRDPHTSGGLGGFNLRLLAFAWFIRSMVGRAEAIEARPTIVVDLILHDVVPHCVLALFPAVPAVPLARDALAGKNRLALLQAVP